MSSLRQMHAQDLLHLTACNLDPLTETYGMNFYLEYLAKWPQCSFVIVDRAGRVEGYLLGKVESSPSTNAPSTTPYDPRTNTNAHYLPWHAHVTALSVAPGLRRRGHARKLTEALEAVGDADAAWFVDLYVRSDNSVALGLYRGMGYSVFRRVAEYYNDGCDAFDMRKPLARDANRLHVRERGEDVVVDPMMVW